MSQHMQPLGCDGFEIAIISALPAEFDAVEAILSERWDGDGYWKGDDDPNRYIFGRIGRSAVVLTLLPGMGKEHAASGSAYFRTSFPGIKLCLLVGICAGSLVNQQGEDILLGDVIISTQIVQSDFGRQLSDGIVRKDTTSDNFGRPSKEIRALLAALQTSKASKKLRLDTVAALQVLVQAEESWDFPGRENDLLFRPEYEHKHHVPSQCQCGYCNRNEACEVAQMTSCETLKCDLAKTLVRQDHREDTHPFIHFGAFSTTDQVVRSSGHREKISSADNVIGFEMEGAGVWDNFPTVIIKGACDYADNHKNKKFQRYAAAAAAACAKAFLTQWRTGRRTPGELGSAGSKAPGVSVINNHFAGGTFSSEKAFFGGNFTSHGPMNF